MRTQINRDVIIEIASLWKEYSESREDNESFPMATADGFMRWLLQKATEVR